MIFYVLHFTDLAVIGALIWLAWRSLFTPELLAASIFFISFSVLLAVAWARLDAPDLALAEAAIGAGLTGALLLAAVRRMEGGKTTPEEAADESA